MRTRIDNLKGFAEWRGKKIIKLADVTLYFTPLDQPLVEKLRFDRKAMSVTGMIADGATLPRAARVWKNGIKKRFSSFCSDKIVLESKEMGFAVTDVEFDTPFESGQLNAVEFHGVLETVLYKTEAKKAAR